MLQDRFKEVLPSELRELRLRHGLSQKKMAAMLNLSESTWIRYETGEKTPDLTEAMRIYGVLGEQILPPLLRVAYPDHYVIDDPGDIKRMQNAIIHYWMEVASPKLIAQMYYVMFGDHGGSFIAKLQEWVQDDHLPMDYRVIETKISTMLFDLAGARNELVCPDDPMPDRDVLLDAILQGEGAANEGRNSYSV